MEAKAQQTPAGEAEMEVDDNAPKSKLLDELKDEAKKMAHKMKSNYRMLLAANERKEKLTKDLHR